MDATSTVKFSRYQIREVLRPLPAVHVEWLDASAGLLEREPCHEYVILDRTTGREVCRQPSVEMALAAIRGIESVDARTVTPSDGTP